MQVHFAHVRPALAGLSRRSVGQAQPWGVVFGKEPFKPEEPEPKDVFQGPRRKPGAAPVSGVEGLDDAEGDSLDVSASEAEVRRNKPSLAALVQDLWAEARGNRLTWVSSSSNLETTLNGYPVRLAELSATPGLTMYKFQVFQKGFFSGFRAPLYNLDVPTSEPVGQKLAQVYQAALQSIPELYESDRGKNRGIRLFEIGRSRYTLVFPKKRSDAQAAAGTSDVLFLIKRKGLYYGFTEVTQTAKGKPLARSIPPTPVQGYISSREYVPLQTLGDENQPPQVGLSREEFGAVLQKAGVTLQQLIAKGRQLLEA